MLKIARILIVALCCILICVLGTIYSFIRFKNPSNVGVMARWFGRLYPLFGLKVEHRFPQNKENMPRCKKPNLDSFLRYFILGNRQYFLGS